MNKEGIKKLESWRIKTDLVLKIITTCSLVIVGLMYAFSAITSPSSEVMEKILEKIFPAILLSMTSLVIRKELRAKTEAGLL